IPAYFPAAVAEEEWLATRAGRAARLNHRGRIGNTHVNVFAGLLVDAKSRESYICTTKTPKGGIGYNRRVLINNAALECRGRFATFRFPTFEKAVLSCLREIDPHEILNGDQGPDETQVLAGKLARVEAKIAELEAELLNGDVAALAKVLRQQEAVKRELTEKL